MIFCFYTHYKNGTLWSNPVVNRGRICEVLAPAKHGTLSSLPLIRAMHSTGILLCEANRLPPVFFFEGNMNDQKALKKQTRKGSTPIVVRVTPDEKSAIENFAKQTGSSTSSFLRLLGLGYMPKSIVDNEKVLELARINGDLGRLGGLLKLWLTNDARTVQFGESTIRATLARIEATQEKMLEIMKSVVMPRTEL